MTSGGFANLGADEKRALLKRLLAERAAGVGDHALAHGQRAIWFLQYLVPDTYAYNVSFAGAFRPGIDLAAFRRALDRLVARHAALRTVFPSVEGEPVQRVQPPGPTPVHVVELPDATDDEVAAAVLAAHRQPFDLAVSPIAVTVFRRPHEDALVLGVHHIVSDAWSMQIVGYELRALYEEETGGPPADLPALAVRYTDFVAAQTRMLAGEHGEALWAYWARTLAGPLPQLEIPTAVPRPPVVALRGASVPLALGPELSAAVYALARGQGTTLYSVLLAALQVTLYHFTRHPDVVVGTPVTLRATSDFERVVGYFVNTVATRGQVRSDEPFATLLARAREQVLGAIEHQELPFPVMVDRLQIRRESNRNPIFQAMLNVVPVPRTAGAPEPMRFGASRVTPYTIPGQEGQFELAVEVADTGGVIDGYLKYQTDVYDARTAHEIRDAFVALLTAATARPEASVAELLGEEQREDFEL